MVLDSSIFIEYLRATDKTKTTYWRIPDGTALYVSVVTLYELYMGATNPKKWNDVSLLIDGLTSLSLTRVVSEEAARIFQDLRSRNELIGHRDIFIAATALVYDHPVKTFNVKHFSRVTGLKIA